MGLLQTTSKFMVKSAAYIVRNGRVTEQERWRRTGFSPSTSLPRFALVQRHWAAEARDGGLGVPPPDSGLRALAHRGVDLPECDCASEDILGHYLHSRYA